MKPESMRISFLVLFFALTAIFTVITWPFVKAAFLAFTIAVIFFPMHRYAVERFKLPRYVSAVGTTLIVGACVLLPLAVLAGVVVTQIGHFIQGFASQAGGGTVIDAARPMMGAVLSLLERITGAAPSMEELEASLLAIFNEAGRKLYEFSPRVLKTTASVAVNFFLTLVFLIVFLAEGGALYGWIMETTPLSEGHRHELARDVRVTITSSIIAAVVTAIIQGTLLGLGFWVAGFSQPYGWGLVAIILSLIPVVGAASCYITATSLLLSAGDIKGAAAFALFGVGVISTIDNVVRPIIMQGVARMHPLLLFVTLIGSVKLFGPIGLIVGPVLLSIFLASLRIYRREFAKIGR